MCNEAEVIANGILPWLASLGFDAPNLHLERTFSIRVGRQNVKVGEKTKSARFDILIRDDNRNICIVEAKASDVKIAEAEIEQAVSYARLLHPIAPVAVITNGTDWRMVDSITRENISKERHLEALGATPALPDESYIEALKHFLGLSRENLLRFFKAQVISNQKPYRTLAGGMFPRYVPEIYIAPKSLDDSFEAFLASDCCCFLVLGSSGAGKSCWACTTVERLLAQGKAVAFFRGMNIRGGIFDALSEELQWVLSPQKSKQALTKEMAAAFKGEEVILFVDAIDEIDEREAPGVLDDAARALAGLPFRLVCTCKEAVWPAISQNCGVQTVFAVHTEGNRVSVPPWSNREYHKVVQQYRQHFGFRKYIVPDVEEQCRRDPFFLRLCFEWATKHPDDPLTGDQYEFYDNYINTAFCAKDTTAKRDALHSLGQTLFYQDTSLVHIDDLSMTKSGFGETIDNLCHIGLLQKIPDPDGGYRVGFQYDGLRDYVISFISLGLSRLGSNGFTKFMAQARASRIGVEVLSFYYRVTPKEEHRSIIDAPARSVLDQRWKETLEFLDAEIGGAIEADPFFGASVGAVGLLNVRNGELNWMGYRPLKPGQPKLHLIPASEPWPEFEHSFDNNVDYWYHPQDGQLPLKPIKDLLERAISRGTLDEAVYPPLLFEKAVALVLKSMVPSQRKLPPQAREYRADTILPLSIDKMIDIVNREKWQWIVSNEVTQAAIEKRGQWFNITNNEANQKTIHECGIRDDDARFVAVSLDKEDTDGIAEEVERRAAQPAPMDNAPLKNGKALERAARELQRLGVNEITEVPGFGKFTGVDPLSIQQEDRPQYEEQLLEFERHVINAYITVTQHCFGPLAEQFTYIRDMPIGMLMAFNWSRPTPTVYSVRFRLPAGSQVVVIRCSVKELTTCLGAEMVEYKRASYPLLEYSERRMLPAGAPPLQGASVINNTCPLRTRLYSLIKEEFDRAWRILETQTKGNKPRKND